MKVLISAYACEPNRGSEPEVGWRWVHEIAKFHEVVVLTRANNREVIESHYARQPHEHCGIRFVYFDLSARLMSWKKRFTLHEIYYVLWQRKARKKIDQLLVDEDFDLVHLVTFASFRYPVLLSKLKVPVVWGPVGGGEIAPWGLLWYRLRFPACIKEVVRNVATSFSGMVVRWVDPTRTSGGRVIASTPRTQAILTRKGIQSKLMPAIGMDVEQNIPIVAPPSVAKGLKFIFVGRLVLLKGGHLLLEAFAKARLPDASLTIVGEGSERGYLESLANQLGICDQVKFLGYVPKQKLSELYAIHHVVVGPSLYESGGYMVLEAFQQRRPAIVLDVGGLALSVDESCGIKVPQGTGAEVVRGLANAMSYYKDHPELIALHGQAGFEKICRVYAWREKAKMMERVYEEVVLHCR